MLQAARANVGVQRGLFFGAFIAAGNLIAAVTGALFSASALGVASGLFSSSSQLIALTVAAVAAALDLVAFALLLLAGASAYQRTGRISAGVIAGLVAGGLGGLVGALTSVIILVISFNLLSVRYAGLSGATVITTSGVSMVAGLLLDCGVGAGLGALGAFIRQSVFR